MIFTGICDEAAKTLPRQFEAHNQLGWDFVELRKLGSNNLSTIDEAGFEHLCNLLEQYKLKVSGYASKIGDWSRKITDSFEIDRNDLLNTIPRMQVLDIKYIRIMSYINTDLSLADWKKESIKRIRELTKIAEDNDIVLTHENCTGWGGISWQNNLDLINEVDSPALKVLFDTGNPPTYGQSAWEYYKKVKDHIAYIHIKDSLHYMNENKPHFTKPGEGDGCINSIIRDLLVSGYQGFVSIEPHVTSVIHKSEESENNDLTYNSYINYGECFKNIMAEAEEAMLVLQN